MRDYETSGELKENRSFVTGHSFKVAVKWNNKPVVFFVNQSQLCVVFPSNNVLHISF